MFHRGTEFAPVFKISPTGNESRKIRLTNIHLDELVTQSSIIGKTKAYRFHWFGDAERLRDDQSEESLPVSGRARYRRTHVMEADLQA